MTVVDKLIEEAIDFHVHTAPDPFRERRLDAIALASEAKHARMKAIVIKCHHYGTAPLAYVANTVVSNFILIGSLVLNSGVGGLNPEVVEVAAKGGARVVWMPTFSSVPDTQKRLRSAVSVTSPMQVNSREGISLIGKDNKLVPEMAQILEIIKDYDIVLGTGHTSRSEIYAVTDEAKRMGIKVTITHPLSHIVGSAAIGSPLTIEHQKQLVSKGAYIEHCFVACMPLGVGLDPMVIVDCIKRVGAESCILSTDFGQIENPPPLEGFRMMIASMLKLGLSERELEILVKINPSILLGLT